MRRKAKTDANHQEVREHFRGAGFSVADTSPLGNGFPDLVIAKYGFTILIEVKDGLKPPSKRALTPDEEKFKSNWKGEYRIIETIDQAIELVMEIEKWQRDKYM